MYKAADFPVSFFVILFWANLAVLSKKMKVKRTSVSGSEISSRQVKLFPGLQILLASICYMYEDLTIQCCLGTSLHNILR